MTTTLITGASSGLGAEMARQFAALGHDLALVARRVDRLDGLQTELLAAHPGRRVEVRALDVTDPVAVRQVVHELNAAMGGLDRVIVNAGLGKGAPIGTGGDAANRETAQTNVLGALAQCESAMEVFRQRGQGHLVVISSVSAMRGMPKAMTTYAASKAFVAHLAEGIRAEVMGEPGLAIDVTTVYPGYIRSEMNDRVVQDTPLMVSTEEGVRAIVVAVEKRAHNALVPPWPWEPIGRALKVLPLQLVRRLG